MNLYQIDSELMKLLSMVDEDTGEWLGADRYEELQVEREKKLEGIAVWIKSLDAEVKALREEEKKLAERRTKTAARCERLKTFLMEHLNGEQLKTSRCVVAYRKAPDKVDITDMDKLVAWCWNHEHGDLIEYAQPTVSKTSIKSVLQSGEEVDGAELITDGKIMTIK